MRFSIKSFAVLPTLSLLFKRPSRLLASFSVRTRGVSDEGDVGSAFQTVKQSRLPMAAAISRSPSGPCGSQSRTSPPSRTR
jgi:hypothetical protein